MSLLKDGIKWLYWFPFRRLIQSLSPRLVYRLGRVAGGAMFLVARSRRAALMDCARLVLASAASVPGCDVVAARANLAPEALAGIAREALVNFCCNELETLLFPVLSVKVVADITRAQGLEHLDAALAQGHGAMLLFAHFGANQMIMPAVGHRGYAMSQLSAPATIWKEKFPGTLSPLAEKVLEQRWRHELSLPVRHINIFGSLKEAFRCLKKNEVLGVACDGGGGAERLGLPFLGQTAYFPKGAMSIALRTGCAVLPTFMLRDAAGLNTLVVEPALELVQDEDHERAIAASLNRFLEVLQRYVIRHPSHYAGYLAFRRFMTERGDFPFLGDAAGVAQETVRT